MKLFSHPTSVNTASHGCDHIGIVAYSAEGAALCYRTVCVEGARLLGPHAHPEISMNTRSLAEYVKRLDCDDWPGIGELMLASANKLAKIGADFNLDHRCPGCTSPKWSLLNPPSVATADLAFTGTRWLLNSAVYRRNSRRAGWRMSARIPTNAINRTIMDELVRGIFKPEAVA